MPTSWKGPGLCNVELRRDIAGCAGREEQKEEGYLRALSVMQHTLELVGPDQNAAFQAAMEFAIEIQEGALRQEGAPEQWRPEGDDDIEELDPKPT